jgi:hypothetical protein
MNKNKTYLLIKNFKKMKNFSEMAVSFASQMTAALAKTAKAVSDAINNAIANTPKAMMFVAATMVAWATALVIIGIAITAASGEIDLTVNQAAANIVFPSVSFPDTISSWGEIMNIFIGASHLDKILMVAVVLFNLLILGWLADFSNKYLKIMMDRKTAISDRVDSVNKTFNHFMILGSITVRKTMVRFLYAVGLLLLAKYMLF